MKIILIFLYFGFILYSFIFDIPSGQEIGKSFLEFFMPALTVMPFLFILIGLFEVWVKKETIEKHFGEDSGFKGYLWAILLSTTTFGGLYMSFPVAYLLFKKRAKLSIVFTYVGSAGFCRVLMTTFEATFMGIKFTLIRLLIGLPLVILTGIFLDKYLRGKNYKIMEP
jgi:uncharacterized membrane protein YraQ (UPF0718 family)